MSTLGRRGVWALALLGLSLGAVAVALFLRKAPEPSRAAEPGREVAARLKLQEALRDASLMNLIQNARVAARKGDSVTHDAMLTGLRREPGRARTLIKGEITRSNDSADIAILNRMIEELP